jgi:hypothetical protein
MVASETIIVPQPDAKGEFTSPAEGAKFMASYGIPQIPLRGKAPWFEQWQNKATTNFAQIDAWYATYKCNFGSVAKGAIGGKFVFEVDSTDVRKRHFADTNKDFTQTLTIVSRQGGHRWYLQTPQSIALGNCAQGFVKHNDFSLRVNDQQCVSPGSVHPETGKQYAVSIKSAPVEVSDTEIEWFRAQKTQAEKKIQDDGVSPISEHARNDTLASIAGRLRNAGLDYEQMRAALSDVNQKRCIPALPESEVETIAGSYAKYPAGSPEKEIVLLGGKVLGAPTETSVPASAKGLLDPAAAAEAVRVAQAAEAALREAERIENEKITASLGLDVHKHPKFPRWIFAGTSVYEGLVKPICDVNSREPEFIFVPAVVLLLNYVANKVRVKHKQLIPSLFMVSIAKPARTFKSACVNSAIEYFKHAGMVDNGDCAMENANGRALVWKAGSPEGLGIEMSRLKCKNAILFYDELKELTSKASIEGSSLSNALLTLYESGKYANLVKDKKKSYSFDPHSYCASLIACCTEESFSEEWAKLVGRSSGLESRMTFLYEPEVLKPLTTEIYVETAAAAIETRRLVDQAIQQGVFEISNSAPLQEQIEALGVRGEARAEKFALFFAIDLGLDCISEDCIERGLALAKYEQDVKRFLALGEAETKEAALQQKIVRALQRNKGLMDHRRLRSNCHASRYGTTAWSIAYSGLRKDGQIKEEGGGVPSDPKMVRLIRNDLQDE